MIQTSVHAYIKLVHTWSRVRNLISITSFTFHRFPHKCIYSDDGLNLGQEEDLNFTDLVFKASLINSLLTWWVWNCKFIPVPQNSSFFVVVVVCLFVCFVNSVKKFVMWRVSFNNAIQISSSNLSIKKSL